MATDRCRQKGTVPVKAPPKFFKIIVNPKAHNLRVPLEFTRRLGYNLPNHVFLKVPSSSLWKIELLHSNGETWLQKGWKEFKDYYSITFGHFLVFEYNGTTQFDVSMFDATALEIEYPLNAHNDKDLETRVQHSTPSDPEDSVAFLQETHSCPKGKAKNVEVSDNKEDSEPIEILKHRSSQRETGRKKKFPDDFVENSTDNCPSKKPARMENSASRAGKEDSSSKVSNRSSPSERVRPRRAKHDKGKQSQVQKPIDKETSITYQRAKAFQADNPSPILSIISFMHPSYITAPHRSLVIPMSFARKVLHDGHNEIKLVWGEKVWSARCSLEPLQSRIICGWTGFARDTALKVGDACLIEVNKSNNLHWNFTIFRC